MKDFRNKVIVITGAAAGMGRAYALAFAKRGSILALCDIDNDELENTLNKINETDQIKIYSSCFDISDEQQTNDFAAEVKQKFGNVDIVINNAGIEGSCEPVWATEVSWFKKVMQVNYFGVVNGTKAFLPQLQENNSGVIVNVSSIFGLVGTPNHADYCASKYAVRGFTEALMVELSDTKIQVHLLHPGGIDTQIARKEQSRNFSKKYLTTSADDVAKYVIKCIQKNKIRIIYGNNAYKTWMGSRILPLKLLIKLIWSEMKSIIQLDKYPSNKEKK